MTQEIENLLIEKLNSLRNNNNKLIKDSIQLVENNERLNLDLQKLEKDLAEFEIFYSQISSTLLEICSQLTILKENSKKKETKKSKQLKKSKVKIDLLEKVQNMDLKEKSKIFSEIIIFLFNEYAREEENP